MFGYSKLKVAVLCGIIALGVFFASPNFLPTSLYNPLPQQMKTWFRPVTLGLDLQGGAYLVMEVDTATLINEKLDSLATLTRKALREERVRIVAPELKDGTLQIKVLDNAQMQKVRDTVRKQENVPLDITSEGNLLIIKYSEEALNTMKQQAVEQSLDIVRRRIDALGTKEPQIQQQGLDRIVVQLPGVQDPSEIKALMGKTAKLTFHLVDEETSPQLALAGKIPNDSMLMVDEDSNYLVLKRAIVVGGESLEDARLVVV